MNKKAFKILCYVVLFFIISFIIKKLYENTKKLEHYENELIPRLQIYEKKTLEIYNVLSNKINVEQTELPTYVLSYTSDIKRHEKSEDITYTIITELKTKNNTEKCDDDEETFINFDKDKKDYKRIIEMASETTKDTSLPTEDDIL